MKNKVWTVAFTGGGTGGHIYPGLAVADSFRKKIQESGRECRIIWIGSLSKMDKSVVQNSVAQDGKKSADKFYGIPSGKLRRYFSVKNFFDVFKIFFGFVSSFFILLFERPAFLFSKGGFVSVPPCIAARILGIRVYTHECDFTPGLATRINSRFAYRVLLSYQETRAFFANGAGPKFFVSGNPVRPVFYQTDSSIGLSFIGYKGQKKSSLKKPVLFAMGGSLGAAQINDLVLKNLDWLCKNFIVVHQTGKNFPDFSFEDKSPEVKENYHPFKFIYSEMPHVLSCADVVLSRAGANSIWECAVLSKPMVLVPLEGSGTRGDQVDNAEFFQKHGAALVLKKSSMTDSSLKSALEGLLSAAQRKKYSDSCKRLVGDEKPSEKIANFLFEDFNREIV